MCVLIILENDAWYDYYNHIFEKVYDCDPFMDTEMFFVLRNLDLLLDLIYINLLHSKHAQVSLLAELPFIDLHLVHTSTSLTESQLVDYITP